MSSNRRSRSRKLKKVLANIFVVLLAIITVLLLVGLFLPRHYRVERSVSINAKLDSVYPLLSGLRHWPEWTVWNQEMDPAVQFTYDSPDSGTGAGYHWTGPKLGRGALKLTKAEPDKGVWYDLEFNDGQFQSSGSLQLRSGADGVQVVWVNEGDLGKNPVNRYIGLMMDRTIGADFEKGLANLKSKAERAGPH